MNWDQVEGNWKQFKGKVQQQWGSLTDDDLDKVEGKQTELSGILQKRYGKSQRGGRADDRRLDGPQLTGLATGSGAGRAIARRHFVSVRHARHVVGRAGGAGLDLELDGDLAGPLEDEGGGDARPGRKRRGRGP